MPAPPIKQAKPVVPGLDVPTVFFDDAPTIGFNNGVIGFSLTALIYSPKDAGAVQTDNAVVAYLRTTVAGAKALRAMLDNALLMAEPVSGEVN